jgi:hypothetical protein
MDDLANLTIGHWNASNNRWERMSTNNSNVFGTLASGRIVSDVSFPNYSPITYGAETSSNPLPIDLVDFDAKLQNNATYLTWTTLSETNNDYFEVERSSNGVNYEKIATIDGAGNSVIPIQYSHIDNSPFPGVSYYRLRQVDLDGQFTYSEVVTIENKLSDNKTKHWDVRPSITSSAEDIVVNLENYLPNEQVSIRIIDVTGCTILEKSLVVNNFGKLMFRPLESKSVASGVYTITLTGLNGSSYKSIIIK